MAITTAPIPSGATTFRKFAQRWTSGELQRKYPDHVPQKKTAAKDAGLLEMHVYLVLGPLALRDITLATASARITSIGGVSRTRGPTPSQMPLPTIPRAARSRSDRKTHRRGARTACQCWQTSRSVILRPRSARRRDRICPGHDRYSNEGGRIVSPLWTRSEAVAYLRVSVRTFTRLCIEGDPTLVPLSRSCARIPLRARPRIRNGTRG